MPRRKIVFVIVEGPSDDEALGVILNRIYDKNVVHVQITYGDITSAKNVCPENIAARIGNLLREYAQKNHYKVSDFQEVIHLIDMDGTYIPESAVQEDLNAEKPYYTTTEIRTARPEQIIERNKTKAENIDRICFCAEVQRAFTGFRVIPFRLGFLRVRGFQRFMGFYQGRKALT